MPDNNKPDITIQTPAGAIAVSDKHDAEYPGVYIELAPAGSNRMLACIEFDAVKNQLQTVVYQPDRDEPVAVIPHKLV